MDSLQTIIPARKKKKTERKAIRKMLRSNMRKFICLFYFSVFCIFFGNAQEQESEIFTLEEFLAMVKRYHPIVAQANLELSGAEAKLLKIERGF